MKPQIVVTGVRESWSVTCSVPLDKLAAGTNPTLLTKGNKVERWLVFNDGAFEIPCGEEEYEQFLRCVYSQKTQPKPKASPVRKLAVLPDPPRSEEVPEGVQTFSASDDEPPPPPDDSEDDEGDDTDWSGETDDADDGVTQA